MAKKNLQEEVTATENVAGPSNEAEELLANVKERGAAILDDESKEPEAVNWRSKIKPEFIVINKDKRRELEQMHQKPLEEIDPADIEDKYLLILLGGFRDLAFQRGFHSITYKVHAAQRDFVSMGCQIEWTGNEEDNEKTWFRGGQIIESHADATIENTSGLASKFLTAIAENRAFVRCVRNSLGIQVLGQDEIDVKADSSHNNANIKRFNPTEPRGVLQDVLQEKRKSFLKFKEEWVALGNEDAKNWNTIEDIPDEQIFSILDKIRKSRKVEGNNSKI